MLHAVWRVVVRARERVQVVVRVGVRGPVHVEQLLPEPPLTCTEQSVELERRRALRHPTSIAPAREVDVHPDVHGPVQAVALESGNDTFRVGDVLVIRQRLHDELQAEEPILKQPRVDRYRVATRQRLGAVRSDACSVRTRHDALT